MKKIIATLIGTLSFTFFLKAQTQSRIPAQESPIETLDLSVNRVNYLHQYFPNLDGNGLIVSLKEYRFDSLDLDLLGKRIPSPFSAARVETHATQMATILGGHGNTFKTGKGVAPEVWFSSANFLNLNPEPLDYYLQSGVSVQNHSYGLGIENFYGAEAEAYDNMVYHNPTILHVFSAGNMGEATENMGPYAGVPNFANLTGTFKMAKNVLTVGAVDAFLKPESASSKGPAYDGRIKPELVAYGEDGTSGSAAIVSGLSVLLQQAYSLQYEQLPSVALLRSILINSADDLGTPGPDFTTGYGNLNAQRALQVLQNQQYWEEQISADTSLIFEIEVPDNIHQLKITLAWIDPPAEENQDTALLHDLDLSLSHAPQDSIWLPWVLDSRSSISALQKPAQRSTDHLNNQEQISVQNPKVGTYKIRVQSHQLTNTPQAFALSYQLDTLGQFHFTFPVKAEQLEANQIEMIRWDYSGPETKGKLWYRILPSNDWQLLSDSINLSQEWQQWSVPSTFGAAQLRMEMEANNLLSDTFIISPVPQLNLVFDCGERLLLQWDKITGAESYQLYELVGDRMEATTIVRDTFYEVAATQGTRTAYSIAARSAQAQIGIRSLALQAEKENQVCYISNFSGSLLAETAFIDIELSTLYQVAGIELQKWDGENYQLIQDFTPDRLQFFYRDEQLQKGNNFYQLVVKIEGTSAVVLSTVNIFFVPLNDVLLYPNPILAGQLIEVSLPIFTGRRIQIYDALGRLMLDYDFLSEFDILETQNWTAGVYFFQIVNEVGGLEHQGKLVVK